MSILSFNAILLHVTQTFNLPTVATSSIKADNKDKEELLTKTIQDMKRKSCSIQEELRMASLGNGGGTASLFNELEPSQPLSLTSAGRKNLATDIIS